VIDGSERSARRLSGLELLAPRVQDRLGVSTGLLCAEEDKITSRLKRDALVKVARHRLIQRVTRVLLIHYRGHSLHGFTDLGLPRDHAVVQPVGHVLARDAQRGAIFHQTHVVDVRDLGTAHALVDPAHHVAQHALALLSSSAWTSSARGCGIAQQGQREQVVAAGAHVADELALAREDVHLVIVQRVERGGGGRGHPGAVRAALRVADLGVEHLGHLVGHGPHALADLGAAGETRGQADGPRSSPRRR
jgi:hypothetical protein